VKVTDLASPPLSATATVSVTVKDMPEPPVFDETVPPYIESLENATTSKLLFTFTVTDADTSASSLTWGLDSTVGDAATFEVKSGGKL